MENNELEKIKEEYKEFKKFAFKDNLIKMAIAFIMGAAFQNVVKAIADNLLMPIINYLSTQTGTNWRQWKIFLSPGIPVEIEIGKLIGAFVDFVITALILYIIYKKILKGENEQSRSKDS